MINVIYHRRMNRVTIEGHAHSGEPGHDLVCAGVSTLAYTLAANVGNLEDCGMVRRPTVVLEPGKAEIEAKPKPSHKATTELIFQSVCVGFELLAANSPECVSYEILG